MKSLVKLFLLAGLAPVLLGDTSVTNAPVKRFRLPQFNEQGYRTGLLEGDQATLISKTQIDITEMHFTVFSGDETNAVQTTLLAPTATILVPDPKDVTVEGKGAVRVVRADLDASGEDWTYLHAQKKIYMRKNVHVVFHNELTDILK